MTESICLRGLSKQTSRKEIKPEFVKDNYVKTMVNIRKVFKKKFNKIYFAKIETDEPIVIQYDSNEVSVNTLGSWLFGLPEYKPNLGIVVNKDRMFFSYPPNLPDEVKEALSYFCI
jgi:hypothetical protein